MASKKTKIVTPKYKIVADEEHPFFNAYHDCAYIIFHDCRAYSFAEISKHSNRQRTQIGKQAGNNA